MALTCVDDAVSAELVFSVELTDSVVFSCVEVEDPIELSTVLDGISVVTGGSGLDS